MHWALTVLCHCNLVTQSKMVCVAVKPLSFSCLLFSSGEWNRGQHWELISVDQIMVPRQLLFVKLQCSKLFFHFKAAARGCCVRGNPACRLHYGLIWESGRSMWGNCSFPLAQLPRHLNKKKGLFKDSPLKMKGFRKYLHWKVVREV